MKFQDSSFNGLKVTVGTKSVTHEPTHPRSKSNMPHHFFQSWGHNEPLHEKDHLCGYHAADQHLCFRYIDGTITTL